eukprot:TRINITY_DN10836_c1_g1_i1.p1 TRINITY_DN10836_c1_g1~~TRINITY_DN10836_c1_g1_i1.p1  ORF type:complete len:192 (+),score=20.23 TRINITY_DN10836_c1_g1_i1:2474-3049(+)
MTTAAAGYVSTGSLTTGTTGPVIFPSVPVPPPYENVNWTQHRANESFCSVSPRDYRVKFEGISVFSVSSSTGVCACMGGYVSSGLSRLDGGLAVGAGTPTRSLRQFAVAIDTGPAGKKRIQIGWGVVYADATKLLVSAVATTASPDDAIYVATLSKVSASGAQLNIMRIDDPSAPWDDPNLQVHVTVTEQL